MKPNTILFAAAYDNDRQDMIEAARQCIADNNYTQDQVRIADRDGVIVVVAK